MNFLPSREGFNLMKKNKKKVLFLAPRAVKETSYSLSWQDGHRDNSSFTSQAARDPQKPRALQKESLRQSEASPTPAAQFQLEGSPAL